MLIIGSPSDVNWVVADLRTPFVLKIWGACSTCSVWRFITSLVGCYVFPRQRTLTACCADFKWTKTGSSRCCSTAWSYTERLGMTCVSKYCATCWMNDWWGPSQDRAITTMQNEKLIDKETDTSKKNDPNIPYHELIGELQYLVTCTRPDIANTVRSIGRHTDAYTTENFVRSKRVLRYWTETRTYGLCCMRDEADPCNYLKVWAYSDADHANCPGYISVSNWFVILLNGWSFWY